MFYKKYSQKLYLASISISRKLTVEMFVFNEFTHAWGTPSEESYCLFQLP